MNQTMTANCKNITFYRDKQQHPLNDFVNRDGINFTSNLNIITPAITTQYEKSLCMFKVKAIRLLPFPEFILIFTFH